MGNLPSGRPNPGFYREFADLPGKPVRMRHSNRRRDLRDGWRQRPRTPRHQPLTRVFPFQENRPVAYRRHLSGMFAP
jgi:hypothetical protein